MRIGIIGAGITGLTAAYYLKKKGISYKIFSKDVGGLIKTEKIDNHILELAAGVFVGKPDLMNLVEELGLTEQIVYPEIANFQQLVYHDQIYNIPKGPKDFLLTKLLSYKEKYCVIKGLFRRNNQIKSDTIFNTLAPIVGEQPLKKILDPALRGIYGAGIDELSMELVFPNVYKSLVEGKSIFDFLKAKGKPPKMFIFKDGLNTLINKLFQKIDIDNFVQSEVLEIELNTKIILHTKDNQESFDKIIVGCSGEELKSLFKKETEIKNKFDTYESISLSVLHFVSNRKVFPRAFGILLPAGHKFNIVGIMFTSNIFPNVSNGNLLKVMVKGGVALTFKTIDDIKKEINIILGEIDLELIHQKEWKDSIPKYNMKRISQNISFDNIHILGADYNGIGVADRIKIAAEFVNKL